MGSTPISEEMALRIGLAARLLPDTDTAQLLNVLNDAIGLPPTKKKLAALTLKQLQDAAEGALEKTDSTLVQQVLDCLQQEALVEKEPLPPIENYAEGEMSDSIRVACASNRGEKLDGHFGSCKRFLIYQVSSAENRLVDIREIDAEEESNADEKNGYRASLLTDCQLLFVGSIGGPAAAKVVRVGVHPVKKPKADGAREEIIALQEAIGKDASPWLAKVMGQSPEERTRFAFGEMEKIEAEMQA